MNRCLFLFIALVSFPLAGICQIAESNPTTWTNVVAADINLAFGPSSTATWDYSLGFRVQVTDHIRVGLGDLSYGNADLVSGTRHAIMLGPVAEYFAPISDNMSYSIVAGIPIQDRWGAEIEHVFGTAPYGSGSFEYHFASNFALAGTLRVQYITSDAYLRTARMLPGSALITAFGLGFHFYL